MSKPDNPFACAWCDEAAHIRQGRVMLCATHYRISSMRARAARDGKMVPTRDEIASLAAQSMTCVGCKRPMNWLRSSERQRRSPCSMTGTGPFGSFA